MMHIKLFGPTAVVAGKGSAPVSDLGGIKPRQILEILAANPGTPVTKDRLADLLWDGAPPKSYIGTLESYVCVLRRRLGLCPGKRSPLATTSNGYLLDPSAVSVDLADFRRLVAQAAKATPAEGLRLAQKAVAMLDGELLASETYPAWACSERKILQQDVVQACGRAAQNALIIRDYNAAVCMSRLAIDYDSLAEDAWQNLMRALSASGRDGQAIRAYFDLRTALATDLGIEPGPVSRALYMEILCGGSAETQSRVGSHQGRTDVSIRLRLFGQALEAVMGVRLPTLEGPLAELAVHMFANGLAPVQSLEVA